MAAWMGQMQVVPCRRKGGLTAHVMPRWIDPAAALGTMPTRNRASSEMAWSATGSQMNVAA